MGQIPFNFALRKRYLPLHSEPTPMLKTRYCNPLQLRLRYSNGNTIHDLRRISVHKGVSQNFQLKQDVKEIIESFPAEIRESKLPCRPPGQLRIQLVGAKTRQQIENIAYNLGVSVNALLHVKIAEKILRTPEHKKTAPLI